MRPESLLETTVKVSVRYRALDTDESSIADEAILAKIDGLIGDHLAALADSGSVEALMPDEIEDRIAEGLSANIEILNYHLRKSGVGAKLVYIDFGQ